MYVRYRRVLLTRFLNNSTHTIHISLSQIFSVYYTLVVPQVKLDAHKMNNKIWIMILYDTRTLKHVRFTFGKTPTTYEPIPDVFPGHHCLLFGAGQGVNPLSFAGHGTTLVFGNAPSILSVSYSLCVSSTYFGPPSSPHGLSSFSTCNATWCHL